MPSPEGMTKWQIAKWWLLIASAFIIIGVLIAVLIVYATPAPKPKPTPPPPVVPRLGVYDSSIAQISAKEGFASDTLPKEIQNKPYGVVVMPCYGTGQKLRWASIDSVPTTS